MSRRKTEILNFKDQNMRYRQHSQYPGTEYLEGKKKHKLAGGISFDAWCPTVLVVHRHFS